MQFNTTPDTRTNAAPMSAASVNATVRNAQKLNNTVMHVAEAFLATLGMREVDNKAITATDDGFVVSFRNPHTDQDAKLSIPTKWLTDPGFDVEWPATEEGE